MKTITVNVSESVYSEFQAYAKKMDRTTSELIREAMELYWREKIRNKPSLLDFVPASVGKVLKPLSPEDDILGEMLEDKQLGG